MNEIIERALRGEAAREEIERLDAWRRASPENERRYAQIARLLEATRALPTAAGRTRIPTAAELLAERRRVPTRDARPGRRAPKRAAAWLPWAVAAAAVLGLLATWGEREPTPGFSRPMVISTGRAELSTVQLADGSVVRLGPSSRLRILPGAGVRSIALDGLAFFNVADAAERSFRVRTASGDAEVLGTRFELDARGDALRLLVVEGRVALSAGGRHVEVGGGEMSGVVDGSVLEPRRVANPDSVLRWAGTFLVFRSTPLADAAEEIERTYDLRIAITDSVIADRTVTATFVDRSASEVLDVLCSIADVSCEIRPGSATISP